MCPSTTHIKRFWGRGWRICCSALSLSLVIFTFSPKSKLRTFFFLQIHNPPIKLLTLASLPVRVVPLSQFTLSQSLSDKTMSSLPPCKGCSSRCCRTGWSLSPSPSSSPPRTSVSRPRARSTLNVKRQLAEISSATNNWIRQSATLLELLLLRSCSIFESLQIYSFQPSDGGASPQLKLDSNVEFTLTSCISQKCNFYTYNL